MIKIGVVGLGQMGKHHARISAEMKEVEFAGVFDVDREISLALAKQYNVRAFNSLEELLLNVDCLIIAVPTSVHRDIALTAIQAGKHILIEKPIAQSSSEARKIIEKAIERNVVLMVSHTERFNPTVTTLKKALKEEKILLINAIRVGPFPPRVRGSSVIIDFGIHDIDLIRYITDSEPKVCRAIITQSISDEYDTALISFRMESGTLAHITTNWITPFKVRELQIATKHNYYIANLITQQIFCYSRYSEDGSYISKEIPVQRQEPLKLVLWHFIDCIAGKKEPLTSGYEGLANLLIAENCIDSAKSQS